MDQQENSRLRPREEESSHGEVSEATLRKAGFRKRARHEQRVAEIFGAPTMADETPERTDEFDWPTELRDAIRRLRENDPSFTECTLSRNLGLQAHHMGPLGDALAVNTHVRTFGFDFLVTTLRGSWETPKTGGNTSVKDAGLRLLCKGIKANRSLEFLGLGCIGVTAASLKDLHDALDHHPTLQELQLSYNNIGNEGCQIICSTALTLPNLRRLGLGGISLTVDGMYPVRSLLREHDNLNGIDLGDNQLGDAGVELLCSALELRKTCRILELHNTDITDTGVKRLCDTLLQFDHFQKLDIEGNRATNTSAACLGELKARFPKMNLWCDISDQLIDEAAQAARDRATLLEFGAAPATKARLILCGHQYAGKTTLASSLCGQPLAQKKKRRSAREPPDPDAEGRTVGIEVRTVELQGGGTFSLNDLAGQSQYITPHSLLMQGQAVFVIALSLATPKAERQQQFEFWLRFLKARFVPVAGNQLPRVHVVLTHRDIEGLHPSDAEYLPDLERWASSWGLGALRHYNKQFASSLNIDAELYMVDCFEGDGAEMHKLRNALRVSREHLLSHAAPAPGIVELISAELEHLRTAHKTWPIKPEADFWDLLYSHKPALPDIRKRPDKDELTAAVLRFLQSEGEIVWIQQSGLVVLSPPFLCSHIVGRLFAPDWFSVHVEQVQKGYVTREAVGSVFPFRDVEHILSIVRDLDLGFPMDDSTFLLPALLENDKPADSQWQPLEDGVVLGRRLLCTAETDYFGPSFFPRLQVRLHRIFGSALTLWKAGLDGFRAGVVCRVVASHNGQGVDVWVHGQKGSEMATLTLIEDVLDHARTVMLHDCKNINPAELALSPTLLRTHNTSPASVPGYLIKDLEASQEDTACPSHPPAPSPVEPIALLLGRPKRVFSDLWPCAAIGMTSGELRVLVIRSNTQQFAGIALDTDQEEKLIRQAARRSPHTAFIKVHSIGNPTPNDIEAELKQFRPHCVHFVGHHKPKKGFECKSDFPTERDDTCYLDGTWFCTLVSRVQPPLQLACVVANCCQTQDFGRELLPTTQAAVYVGKSPLDAQALGFAATFWRSLFEGLNLDAAFTQANQVVQSTSIGRQLLSDPEYGLLQST